MINQERLLSTFADLAETDNSSRKERQICEKIKARLTALGIEYEEDDTGDQIGGDCGSLYAWVDGQLDLAPIILSAHMDSVEPACGKRWCFIRTAPSPRTEQQFWERTISPVWPLS